MIDAVIAAIAAQLAGTAAKPVFEKGVDAVVGRLGRRGASADLRSRLRKAGETRSVDQGDAASRLADVLQEWVDRFAISEEDKLCARRSLELTIEGSVNSSSFDVTGAGSGNTFIQAGAVFQQSGNSTPLIDDTDEAQTSAAPGLGLGRWIVIALVVAGIIWMFRSCGSDESADFPEKSDPFPAGVSQAQIFAPVTARILACARTRVPQPANCPQELSTSVGSEGPVKWAIHGNPIDGSKIVYVNGVFQVIGHAIMTATYTDSSGQDAKEVHFVKYLSKLRNRNGQVTLIDLTPTNLKPNNPITKNPIAVSWGDTGSAIRQAFKSCTEANTVPLPSGCPQDIEDPGFYDHVKWRIVEDPFGNATWKFNRSWGVLRVTGSYALDVEYRAPLVGLEHKSQNGNYSAIVSLDRGKVSVLSIEER